MRKTITIGKPYIENNGAFVRLCSEIERPSGKFTFWFEVPKEYGQYLCTERCNAFVLAIYEYAMFTDCDIESETPMDEALHYQLNNYGAAIFSRYIDYFHNIRLNIPSTSERICSAGAVGTGFSAGVDSFYTVLKHLETPEKGRRLTHLLLANNGAFADNKNETPEELFFKQVNRLMPAVKEIGLPLITVNTNTEDFNREVDINDECRDYIRYNTPLKLTSVVYALQKLFSVYYIASSYEISKIGFDKLHPDASQFHVIILATTPNLLFYVSGYETNRIGKVEAISNNGIVQRYLSLEHGVNHAMTPKSVRTMFELYSINMLDAFSAVLDTEDFKKHLSSRVGWYINLPREIEAGYVEETLDMCRKNNVKIPLMAYLKSIFYFKPLMLLKRIFKNCTVIKDLYHKLRLDELLYGNRNMRHL